MMRWVGKIPINYIKVIPVVCVCVYVCVCSIPASSRTGPVFVIYTCTHVPPSNQVIGSKEQYTNSSSDVCHARWRLNFH